MDSSKVRKKYRREKLSMKLEGKATGGKNYLRGGVKLRSGGFACHGDPLELKKGRMNSWPSF